MKVSTLTTGETKLILPRFGYQIIFAALVITLAVSAVISKGRQAFLGISWPHSLPDIHESNFENTLITGYKWGIYDPEYKLINSDKLAFDHYFVSWQETPSRLDRKFKSTINNNRWPMITIEPYPGPDLQKENLLTDIIDHQYDSQIINYCQWLETQKHPAFIRWGHEMENINGRYPWAVEDSQSYINAYRHFVSLCKQNYSQGFYIWSPVGHSELINYWPGVDYVDYIGISLFIFTDWEIDHYNRVRPFTELLDERYNLVKQYGKPVIISEMGINGEPEFQLQWLEELFSNVNSNRYPHLKTLVYFNAPDLPEAWGSDYPVPDWRIAPDIFMQN